MAKPTRNHNCPNCGAPIGHVSGWEYTCPYCGTGIEFVPFIKNTVVLEHPKIMKLAHEIMIDDHQLRYMKEAGYTEDRIKLDIADGFSGEALLPYVAFYKNYDIWSGATRYRGVLRVAEPLGGREYP